LRKKFLSLTQFARNFSEYGWAAFVLLIRDNHPHETIFFAAKSAAA
jgi:hypothetical protein